MAENIYSKGTRVWFPDKELGWISAEVASVAKTDDTVRLLFVDERGKVGASSVSSALSSTVLILARLVPTTGDQGRHHRQSHQGRKGRLATSAQSTLVRNR